MTRDDWLSVGMRLMGLYWLVQGLTGLSYMYWLSRMMGEDGLSGVTTDSWLRAGFSILIGVGLFLYSPKVLEWLARRESPDRTGKQGDATDAASPRR